MTDREQVRRDAERWLRDTTDPSADELQLPRTILLYCLALLAELEQAEQREAALVEALTDIRDAKGNRQQFRASIAAKALAAHEQAGT